MDTGLVHFKRFRPVWFFIMNIALVTLLAVCAIFIGIYYANHDLIIQTVKGEAESCFYLITKVRDWNANYGGVYVVKKCGVESSPYLKELGVEPDIDCKDGRVVTLKHPEQMMREMSKASSIETGVMFHVTSLKCLNPQNSPDAFEKDALVQFEAGAPEVWYVDRSGQRPVFRYMKPLTISQPCLGCHKKQHYKLGDVRGGICVNIPFAEVDGRLGSLKSRITEMSLAALALLLGSLFFMSTRMVRRLDEAQDKLMVISITDDLTGLNNRRYIMARLWEEFSLARRSKMPLGAMMLDIDNFKRINDTYGHPTGDEVLRAVADSIKSNLRPYDIPGRFGGEEFLILSPNTPPDDMLRLGERIRQVVDAGEVSHKGQIISVTASVGVTVLRDDDKDPEELLARVDKALYKAKDEGKNRVVAS